VYLKASMSASSQISFAYSTDGVAFTALGGSVTVGRTWFEGIKFGLFSYNLSTATAAGVADFDYFHYTKTALIRHLDGLCRPPAPRGSGTDTILPKSA